MSIQGNGLLVDGVSLISFADSKPVFILDKLGARMIDAEGNETWIARVPVVQPYQGDGAVDFEAVQAADGTWRVGAAQPQLMES